MNSSDVEGLTDEQLLNSFSVHLRECENRSKTVKVILNKCYGGFAYTERGIEELELALGTEWNDILEFGGDVEYRINPTIIAVVERLGVEIACHKGVAILEFKVPLGRKIKMNERGGAEWVTLVNI